MRYLSFSLALMFSFSLAVAAQDIQGIVVDEVSGLPIASAMLRLDPEGGMPGGQTPPTWIKASTGTDGRFLIAKPAAGKYTIECSKPGYLTEESIRQRGPAVEVKADGSVVPALVRIKLMPGAVLSGRVLTADGKPIAGAIVGPEFGNRSGRTNAAGEFEINGLAACEKECKLSVDLDEELRLLFAVKKPELQHTIGPPDSVEFPVGSWMAGQQIRTLALRVPFEPLMTFSGVVLDPPENAEVKLVRKGQRVYAALGKPLERGGKFRFDLMPAGEYRLVVSERMQFRASPLEVPVNLAGDLLDQEISLPKPLRVSGVVQLNGKAHVTPGAVVTFQLRDDRSFRRVEGEVRPDGTFEVSGLSPGRWVAGIGFSFRRTSNQPMPKTNVRARNARPLEIVAGQTPSPIVVELVETVEVRGRILDAEGLPVAGSVIFKNAWSEAPIK
jgi:hypothetical protein